MAFARHRSVATLQRVSFANRDCALAQKWQRRLSGYPDRSDHRLKAPLDTRLESPLDNPQDLPPQRAPDPVREPILTLPAALTAYVLLIAVIHLRVLLPPDLENWTVDVFGFIPKRYNTPV